MDLQSGAAEDRLRKPVNILRDGVDTGIYDIGINGWRNRPNVK